MIKLSKKVEYALMALKHIATSKESIVTAKEISSRYEIPHELLAKVLQKLKNEKVLASNQGINGGYTLLKKPEEITLTYLINIMDGEMVITSCVHGQSKDDCTMFDNCTIKSPMSKIQKELEAFFNTKTISDFV